MGSLQSFPPQHAALLQDPTRLFAGQQRPSQPLPPQGFNRVSNLLKQDRLILQQPVKRPASGPVFTTVNFQSPHQAPPVQPTLSQPHRPAALSPLPANVLTAGQTTRSITQFTLGKGSPSALTGLSGVKRVASAPTNTARQRIMVDSALKEWQSGVKESGGSNRGPRIDTYAKNAKFGKGYEWCGFFTAFNYSQAGFKSPESFASYQKARDFFLYRSYTSRDSGLHARLDQQRQQDEAAGSSRQYFALAESNVFDYIEAYGRYYNHIDPSELLHTWQNIPIAPGDVALFNHGHVGIVVSYDQSTGKLTTIEGNTSGEGPDGKRWTQAVVRKTYDLSKAADRKRFDGFGRAADSDFA